MAGAIHRYEHFDILTDERGQPLRLGHGGMGATFRAYDTRLRRPVALKIIHERSLADATMRRRFFNEARAAALIDHPNVARVLYLCPEEAAECFFAMELIEGESLAAVVARRGPLPADEALDLLRPIVEALAALAAEHLIHRDIKPENIMITRGGTVKLIDFGVAKPLSEGSDRFESVHTDGAFVGSVYFASPEQVLATESLDQRSDFYSLGATLWHMVTGGPPFTGSRYEVQQGHLHRPLDLDRVSRLPRPAVALLTRLLEKLPGERPADIAALRISWDDTRRELSRQPPPVEDDPLADTEVDLSAPPFACTLLASIPAGFGAPPLPARMAVATENGAWCAVREISYTVAPELRARLEKAAQAVLAAPHPGLLSVLEVRDERVVTEWRRGISAAHLLAKSRGGLPREAVLAWLPALAETVDWACSQGFAQTGFTLAHWLVTFEESEETPLQKAAVSPDRWGPSRVVLDPLAAFDPALTAEQTGTSDTQPPARRQTLTTNADFLAALAHALHQLLGGHVDREDSPLPSINEARNDLLRDAFQRTSTAPSATAWAQQFIAAGTEGPRRTSTPSAKTPETTKSRSRGSQKHLFVAATGVAFAALLGGGGWYLWKHQPTTPAASETASSPPPENPPPPLTATAEAPYINSLGMEFVPVPISGATGATRILFCRHETRRRDFAAFATAMPEVPNAWRAPEVSGVKMPAGAEAEAHPVINVPWKDAAAFCVWLTALDRRKGRLKAHELYRLPTDHEWSCAAGIGDREDALRPPKAKSGALTDLFPWGRGFLPANPPPAPHAKLPGNYAGEESRGTWPGIIEGYEDTFITTAPVGSFAPNPLGIFDLGGNAWEWCEDALGDSDPGETPARVLRGASCANSLPNLLNVSLRKAGDDSRIDLCGFRCVLAADSP